MIDKVREMLEEKKSLEREYFELIFILDEMNLPSEVYDKMMMANIAHSLAVIADALVNHEDELQKICKYCNRKCSWWVNGDCMYDNDCLFKPNDEPQTEGSER